MIKKDKCDVAVIGAGWWAVENHIPAVIAHANANLVALCRKGDEELSQVQQRFQVPHAFNDHEEMLDAVSLDAVIVSSPHSLHYEHAKAALSRGLNVLVEKPFTTDVEQAWGLVKVAEENDCCIMVPCGWNFSPMGVQAKEFLSTVGIGEVEHVVLQMGSALADLFAGEPMIETEGAMFRPPPSTWADPKNAGGYGWGQLSHALSLLFQLVDCRIVDIRALCGRSSSGVDIYDAAIARFDNGATGVLSGAATVPKHCGFQMDIRIFGSEGMFLFDVERERLEIRRHDGTDVSMDLSSGDGDYNGVRPVNHFIDFCVGNTRQNPSSGSVAAKAIETLAMLYEQFESQR